MPWLFQVRSLLKGLGELDDDEDDDNKEVNFSTVSGPGDACIRVKKMCHPRAELRPPGCRS
jgi:hypothetical protein